MRLLTLLLVLVLVACQTPRLRTTCKRAIASAVTPIYTASDRMKAEALQEGDVRRARVQLEEARRALELSACDERDRAAKLFDEKVRAQFDAAEEIVERLEAHKGVRWVAVVALRDLAPTFDLEWEWTEDGRTLSEEEMEKL